MGQPEVTCLTPVPTSLARGWWLGNVVPGWEAASHSTVRKESVNLGRQLVAAVIGWHSQIQRGTRVKRDTREESAAECSAGIGPHSFTV